MMVSILDFFVIFDMVFFLDNDDVDFFLFIFSSIFDFEDEFDV